IGRILISLTSTTFCFLRASAAFFCAWYLYLPKSRILQTGGTELGAISTRSSPASWAFSSANRVSTVPWLWPVWSISCTSRFRISSLTRGPSFWTGGGALIGRRMARASYTVAIPRRCESRKDHVNSPGSQRECKADQVFLLLNRRHFRNQGPDKVRVWVC